MTLQRIGPALAGLCFLIVSACVSVPAHRFSPEEVGAWKVTSVEAVVPDGARLIWPKVVDAFADRELPRGPSKTVMNEHTGRDEVVPGERPPITDAIRRAARGQVQAQFVERLRYNMGPVQASLHGQKPVKIVTTLHDLDVPSLGRQLVVGMALALLTGPATAQQNSSMTVTTDIVEAKTGAILVSYPKQTISRPGGESVFTSGGSDPYAGDAVSAMLKDYQGRFTAWLLRR